MHGKQDRTFWIKTKENWKKTTDQNYSVIGKWKTDCLACSVKDKFR